MSVDVLLCEGNKNSPDVRVLKPLLAGHCLILPMGSKYGMGARIFARWEANPLQKVFGILDGDFVGDWDTPRNSPKIWMSSDGQQLGWRWERKEIENYLIDPDVVSRALKEDAPPNYTDMLKSAADLIWRYQAARTALANCRKRFKELKNSFGKKRGRDNHLFPESFEDAACQKGITDNVASHSASQLVDKTEVLQEYENILPDFQGNGLRMASFLYAFAGKDLLWAMDEPLKNLGFFGAGAFREKILLGIEKSQENVGTWLPEWQALERAIDLT